MTGSWSLSVAVWSVGQVVAFWVLFSCVSIESDEPCPPHLGPWLLSLGLGVAAGFIGLAIWRWSPNSRWPESLMRNTWTGSFVFLLVAIASPFL